MTYVGDVERVTNKADEDVTSADVDDSKKRHGGYTELPEEYIDCQCVD